MKKNICFIAGGVLLFAASLAGSLSRQVVRYEISARLLPETKTVKGRESLTWTNTSAVPVSELPFHLYMNAFKNSRTTFMKESGGAHRGFKADADAWGYIDVPKIGLRDGPDLTGATAFIRPDDGNADDQTVMRLDLPEAVPPGGSITLDIDFSVRLPRVFARSGYSGNFFMIGQWFPKIGVLRDGVWNCHQYHALSEFFADFGAYRVELTVPEEYVVGATGKRVETTRNADGTVTYVHVQEDVHDFAWTACPDFVEFHEKYTLDDPAVSTEMILLVHRAHRRQKDRYARALRHGLEFYSRNYGAYPYETITLVDPAPGGQAAGGMEYPTLFTAGTFSRLPGGIRYPEMVTIHEFGHGYWYGIVASNESEEAWLDEGINSYSEIKAMDRYYGEDASLIDFGGLRIGDSVYHRLNVIGSGRFDPIDRRPWDFISVGSYGLNVYSKAALMMLTMERLLGEDVMAVVMKTYYERWKFRHPAGGDFIRVAEEVSGRDLTSFFNQALRSPDKLDYGISDLSSEKVGEPEGVFDGTNGGPRRDGGVAENAFPVPREMYRTVIIATRYGEWVFPQEMSVVFADGEKVRETWDGRDRWKRFEYLRPVQAVSAEVDPGRKLVLDVNMLNNSRRLEPKRGGVIKAALGFMSWLQGLLSFVSL
ncbi:MAG: M1 family metallopeptidase [Candidatus Aminicenantales bacterium]